MKIVLIFYAEFMPYNLIVVKKLLQLDCKVHVVRWIENKLTPYVPPELPGVYYYDRTSFHDYHSLLKKTRVIQPDIILTSGWMDKTYCRVARIYRSEAHIPVIAGSDTQWQGGKQWFNVLFSRFRHKRWFSHLFVSGVWQYEYARLLGYDKKRILMYNLSADVSVFEKMDIERKRIDYPKNLLFIGRFAKVKGLSFLLDAWKSIPDRKGWTLTLVGNGPLRETLEGYPDVVIKDFMSQELLVNEMQNASALILPSIAEPWALVLHEAAAGGLPILASDCCGAVPYFVLENYNGHLFSPGDTRSIQEVIQRLINASEKELIEMSYRSRELSKRINPEIVARALLSVL